MLQKVGFLSSTFEGIQALNHQVFNFLTQRIAQLELHYTYLTWTLLAHPTPTPHFF